MTPIIVLAVLIFISIVVIGVSAAIINIMNQIGDGLAATNYKKLTGDCQKYIEPIESVNTLTSIIRSLAVVPLVLAILIIIIAVAGIIFLAVTGVGVTGKPQGGGFVSKLVTNKYLYLFLIFGLFLIFLMFAIAYIILIANLNNIDGPKCFPGDPTDENSIISKFNKVKTTIVIQLVTSFIMALVFLGVFIFLIVAYKGGSKPKKQNGSEEKGIAQQENKDIAQQENIVDLIEKSSE
jgi:hypothetical protein